MGGGVLPVLSRGAGGRTPDKPRKGGDRAGGRLRSKKVSLDHSGGELAPGSGASLEVTALRPRPGREGGGMLRPADPGRQGSTGDTNPQFLHIITSDRKD